MNTDDVWHVRLYYSQCHYHMSERSVQCAIGTRNREMIVGVPHTLLALITGVLFN